MNTVSLLSPQLVYFCELLICDIPLTGEHFMYSILIMC